MKQPALKFEGICKSFPGVKALEDVSFDVYTGEALALVGANGAGKSTLMNVLGGNLQADSGRIVLFGEDADISNPQDSIDKGIGFVHQEIALMPTMTIAENMFINQFKVNALGLLSSKEMEEECRKILVSLNCNLSPRTLVKHIGTGDKQMVEIARALLMNPKILILDEPTSSLSAKEKERLFEAVSRLKSQGVAVIYITHFLDEVFNICERAVVMRNGQYAGGGEIDSLSYKDIVAQMIGDVGGDIFYAREDHSVQEEINLRVNSITRDGILDDISLELYKGEILGIWGLLGAGRTELVRALTGLDPSDTYDVEVLEDEALVPLNKQKIRRYLGYVTENRREDGLLLRSSILENMSLANLQSYLSFGPIVNDDLVLAQSDKYIKELGIVVSDVKQAVGTLSGGNQQKVIVGRWLQKSPLVLLLDEPTRGLDVGAKKDMHHIIHEYVKTGTSVVLITSDIDELMNMSDRIMVLDRGRITGEYSPDVKRETLMAAASGFAGGEK